MNLSRYTLSILLFLATSTVHSQRTFYVSPGGKDTNTGVKLAEPFLTLEKAIEAINDQPNTGPKKYQILLRGGIYSLSKPLLIDTAFHLHPESSLILAAYGGEKPVISGNKTLPNTWEMAGSNLWKTQVDDSFNQLFVDDTRAVRARFPNEGTWLEPDSIQLSNNRLVFTDKIPQEFNGLKETELHITGYWHYIRQKIKNIDPKKHEIVTEAYPGPEASSRKISLVDRAHFENAFMFLDTENEWFLDAETNTLYLFTAKDPNKISIEYPLISTLLRVEGSNSNPIRQLKIDGITFKGTEWRMPAIGRKGIQAGFWGTTSDESVFAPEASVMLDWVKDSEISNCRFGLLGEGAITLGLGCTNNEISDNSFKDIGANVIQIGYRRSYKGEGHPLHLDFKDQAEVSHGNTISNNHFKNFATTDKGSVGIWVGYSHHNLISHNLMEDFPYSAISVGWYWGNENDMVPTNCHSNTIEWNEIREGMKYLSDGAAIYMVGNQPDTRISDNWIHQIGGGYIINSGIYVDEGGANMEITRNYFLHLTNPREAHPIKLHKNNIPSMHIYNNGGQIIRHEIHDSNKSYSPAKHVNVRLTAPEFKEHYGIQK